MKQARDAVAWIAMNIGMVFALVGIFSFLATQSIFQQGTLANSAKTIMASSAVRADISNAITSSITNTLGMTSPQSANEVNLALQKTFENASVQNIFANALSEAQSHLNGASLGPITIGGPTFQNTLASSLQPIDPSLASLVQKTPLVINIPGTSLPNLGIIKRALPRVERDAFVGAGLLLGFAFIIAAKRRHVIEAIGWRLIAISFFNAFVFFILPQWIIPMLAISWGPVASIVLKAIGGPVIATYITIFVTGIGCISLPRFIPFL
ncbi:hypothetical protein [Acidithrix sp. C25]|uniref:hypothetical protein n=1 Tax=Acidithrix sp. C25 TaxID=1671482 RepID=UPI00191B8FED|nr:hypothetical protein [Acidithrix sp. C25]CAG4924670.1 unnamed protein product [Acidithrix sp. C25]